MGTIHLKLMQPNKQPDPIVKHKRHRTFLLIGIIGLVLLLGGVVSAWFLVGGSKPAQEAIKDSLNIKDQAAAQVTVTSKLGFKLTFDNTFIEGVGQVTTSANNGLIEGEEYTADDLKTPRTYSIVTLNTKVEQTDGNSLGYFYRPYMVVLTSAREHFFESRRQQNPGLSDTDITIKAFAPADESNLVLASRKQEVIHDITYEKLLYEFRTKSTGVVNSYQLQYVTVQNERPHVINLHYYPNAQQGDLAPFMQALESITYMPPDSDAAYLVGQGIEKPTVALAGVTLAADTEETLSTPKTLSEVTDISIVAKNQLAVVRVGTIYCYDLDLLNATNTTAMHLPQTCTAGMGSGSIVREDGFVCTNGHVVKVPKSAALTTKVQLMIVAKDEAKVASFVNYLADLGLIKRSETAAFTSSLMRTETDAISALSTLIAHIPDYLLKVNSEAGQYAIQLGNDPLRLNISPDKLSFNYTKTIVEANLIDAQVDLNNANLETSRTSDVALLDITGNGTFPVVKIGNMADLRKGDEITIVGFPGFVDGGFQTKEKHTVPTATQGRINQLATDAAGNKLVSASTLIAQGNSGGPGFDESGKQIGLATYAALSAVDPEAGKTKFSKEGILRDIADFTKLAATHNITFTGTSKVNDHWYAGIDTFIKGDYGKAAAEFKAAESAYTNHYLVASFIAAAEDQANIGLRRNVLIGAAAFIALLIILGVIRLISVLRHRPQPTPPAPLVTPPTMPPSL